ncbi:hypothetical protein ACFQE0_14705 [Methylobacterium komagatae]|uniref:Uncharacterized protein n=1 Tax=Methylobacterium komagatae TaxID=374425 RepID=A0ABW2BMX5_9HYPH
MDAFNPYKISAFWTGMALGIPMLATELAAEVWGTRPEPIKVTSPVEVRQVAEFTQVAQGDPVLTTVGHDLPVYLASDDLPPPSWSIEAKTALPVWDPAPKPRKRKS